MNKQEQRMSLWANVYTKSAMVLSDENLSKKSANESVKAFDEAFGEPTEKGGVVTANWKVKISEPTQPEVKSQHVTESWEDILIMGLPGNDVSGYVDKGLYIEFYYMGNKYKTWKSNSITHNIDFENPTITDKSKQIASFISGYRKRSTPTESGVYLTREESDELYNSVYVFHEDINGDNLRYRAKELLKIKP